MNKQYRIPLILILICLGVSALIKQHLSHKPAKILPPPQGLENIHFGFSEVLSDSLWLTYIQHVWNCQHKKLCYENWGYRVLDGITLLSPEFKSPYIHGATMLSVLLDDDFGAKEIFDRGLIQYPEDWLLNYRAGYHYLVELNNDTRAADLLSKASENGAPYWTKSLAARLYERSGNLEISEALILSLLATNTSPEWQQSLKERLKDIQRKKRRQKQTSSIP